eukprot:gene11985-biopygen1329
MPAPGRLQSAQSSYASSRPASVCAVFFRPASVCAVFLGWLARGAADRRRVHRVGEQPATEAAGNGRDAGGREDGRGRVRTWIRRGNGDRCGWP